MVTWFEGSDVACLFLLLVVLSSEEEEDCEGNGDEAKRTSHSSNQVDESRQGNSEKVQVGK